MTVKRQRVRKALAALFAGALLAGGSAAAVPAHAQAADRPRRVPDGYQPRAGLLGPGRHQDGQ